MEKYFNMTPGKYWKLPKNKKHLIKNYLDSEDYIPMVKYDGYWARAIISNGEVLIQSRGISKVTGTYGEYHEKVPHITEELLKSFPSGTVVLGELYYPSSEKNVQDVGSILRCKPPKAVSRQKKNEDKLHFAMFDILSLDGEPKEEESFNKRFTNLNSIFTNNCDYTHVSEYAPAGEGEYLLKRTLESGGEGIILIKKTESYNIGGAKAWHSIKVKKEMGEIEVPIIKTIDPEREYKGENPDWPYKENGEPVSKFYYNGWKKGIIFMYNGNEISATSGITEEDGEYLSSEEAQKSYAEGSLYAVVTGMEITKDSIRHPVVVRLRDDI